MEFSVFCIESIAEKLETSGDAVYKMLTEQSDILNDYIVPCYNVLHTQGKEFLVDYIYRCHETKRRKCMIRGH